MFVIEAEEKWPGKPGHAKHGNYSLLKAACSPIAFLNIGVTIRAVVVQVPLVVVEVFLFRIDLTLFGPPVLIPFFGTLDIAVLDGAVFPRLIIVPLSAVLSQLALVPVKVALIGADVAVVVANILIQAVNFVRLLLLRFRRCLAYEAGAYRKGSYNRNRQS